MPHKHNGNEGDGWGENMGGGGAGFVSEMSMTGSSALKHQQTKTSLFKAAP